MVAPVALHGIVAVSNHLKKKKKLMLLMLLETLSLQIKKKKKKTLHLAKLAEATLAPLGFP